MCNQESLIKKKLFGKYQPRIKNYNKNEINIKLKFKEGLIEITLFQYFKKLV